MRTKPEPPAADLPFMGGEPMPPQLAGYLDCFNHGRFFEAHHVLEELWLPRRGKADANFLKGLIQLAGAFVHLQKSRPAPALALFRLARANLLPPVAGWDCLPAGPLIALIDHWQLAVAGRGCAPLTEDAAPRLDNPAGRKFAV